VRSIVRRSCNPGGVQADYIKAGKTANGSSGDDRRRQSESEVRDSYVGPIWHDGRKGEPELLASAYRDSLKLAAEKGLRSISFPSISTGAYGYPVAEAAEIAIRSVSSFLKKESISIREVVFVLFDTATLEEYVYALGKVAGIAHEALSL